MSLRFSAPWSPLLRGITLAIVGLAGWAVFSGITAAIGALALVILGTAALSVRGYEVEPGLLRVLRLGWTTDLDLRDLGAAEADPDAMRRAWRVVGMGGPFAFVGRFRSAAVGPFTAYATDPKRAVVLRWADRTVVLTPDDPEAFVTAVEAAAERV